MNSPNSITVNGAPRQVPQECSVEGLLELLEIRGSRVAVAINRDVVPRSNFSCTPIAAGDQVEILEAVGGG